MQPISQERVFHAYHIIDNVTFEQHQNLNFFNV